MGCINSKEDERPAIKGVGRSEHMSKHFGKSREKKHLNGKNSISETHRTEGMDDDLPRLDDDGHLLPEEVQQRRSLSSGSSHIYLPNLGLGRGSETMNTSNNTSTSTDDRRKVRVDYAICTQQGYYPDDPHKQNQDTFSVTQDMATVEGDSFFAVYDGHGPVGDRFAIFAKQNLPRLMAKYVQQLRANKHKQRNESILALSSPKAKPIPFNPKLFPHLSAKEYETASTLAHLECNKLMIDTQRMVNLSGTTAISAAFHNGKIIISNVGDSRAILGYIDKVAPATTRSKTTTSTEHKIIAIPLSADQTPWRQDERDRVIKAGARVVTVDQMEGIVPIDEDEEIHNSSFGNRHLQEDFIDLHGDPPRVWLKDSDKPGTSFTRSLGDSIAETVGVFAEPEFFSKDITDNDQILVLASDGVFEFLSNQEVIDMCASAPTPSDACDLIVTESYKKWLTYERRTDDITVICIKIGGNDSSSDNDGMTPQSPFSEEHFVEDQ